MRYHQEDHNPTGARRCPRCKAIPRECENPVDHYDPDWEFEEDE